MAAVFQRALARNVRSRGPAVDEPDLPSLTKTATARSPCAAIIQACVFNGSELPYSAVPVLAMIGGPSLGRSTLPLPSVTTLRIIERNWSASPDSSGLASDFAS